MDSVTSYNPSTSASIDQVDQAILYIVGHQILQNELLARYLETTTHIPANLMSDNPLQIMTDHGSGDPLHKLILVESTSMEKASLPPWLSWNQLLSKGPCSAILYNVNPGDELDALALARGFRGVLHCNEPLEVYARAIRAVLDGELWFPRRVLAERFLQIDPGPHPPAPRNDNAMLTVREREILMQVASGKGNKEIAQSFYLSPHTIKTHIYNIYRKIGVCNRMQAAIWLSGGNAG